MVRKPFAKAYKEYVTHYTEKNYGKCLDVFQEFNLKAQYLKNKDQIEFVLKSACHSLSLVTNPKNSHKISVANGFNDVFTQLSTTSDYMNFFSILNAFTNDTNSKGLERYLPRGFDSASWLQNVNVHLFKVLNNANIIDDNKQTKQKEIYLQLTCTLLYFVNVESQRAISMKLPWQFSESKRFLKNCTEFRLFQNGDTQYSNCFELLIEFLECLRTKDKNGEFADNLQIFLKRLKNLLKSNEYRATLFRDIFVVLTKATKIYEEQFDQLVNVKNCKIFFDFIGCIANGVTQSKTEKRFLCSCDDTNIHLSQEITTMAVNKFMRLLSSGLNDVTVAENLGYMIRKNFETISKLTCSKSKYVQHCATSLVRNLMKSCESKETGQLAAHILELLLKRYHRIKLIKEVPYFDQISMISYAFKANSCAENWDEAIDIGYLLIALMSFPESSPHFEHTAWTLAKIQKDQDNFKSPFDHFDKHETESLHGFKLPNDFNLIKLSLAYLKVGIKYSVMSTELSNKIIHQLLMSASKDDFSPLRFALLIQSMNFDRVTTERVEALTNAWRVKADSDRSIGLQLAAIKYYKFNFDATKWTEKYKDLHISGALTEEEQALETNVFKEITFNIEKKQIVTLRYIKEKFIDFAEYYINASDADRAPLGDEKEYLLRELKMLANQFIVRGYVDDGMDLFMALNRLSIVVDDEFGLIDSCSFFAEHSVEFKQKFPSENLKSMVEGCFGNVIKILKILKDLSSRKQNQVGFCMLNLVLFYLEDDGDHSKEIHMILKFIFTSIGGIRDKNMGDCLKAATGKDIPNSNGTIGPQINSEAVRIKFYTVLFTMVTKYNAPSTFSPCNFLYFVMDHIRKHLIVYSDSSAAVPILLYNMIPQMLSWLHSTYEVNLFHQSLQLTLLKLAIRSGYALRTSSILMTLIQANLLTENLKYCKPIFMALQSITLTPCVKEFMVEKDKVVRIDNGGHLCEPIRKQGVIISPIKNGTPSPTPKGSQTHYVKFLQEHPSACDCGPCFSSETKFQMFCAAIVYARFVYINEDEFSAEAMRSVFHRLLKYWEDNKNKFPRTDMFYVMSARMLLYVGHYFWKFENDRDKAVTLLKRGSKGLTKVKYGACLIKQDLELQIKSMDKTIEEQQAPREKIFLRLLKRFNNEPSTDNVPNSNFQIHSDGASSLVTPRYKKTTRNRLKCVDETPARTPSQRVKPGKIVYIPKTVERPTREARMRNLIPTVYIDLDSDDESTKESK